MTRAIPSYRDDPLTCDLVRTIDAHALLAPKQTVVVGVSGGLDSVALLTMLAAIARQPDRDHPLIVAHLNHAIREDADADQSFVTALAESLNLPVRTEHVDVASRAANTGESVETAARAARYEFLRNVAQDVGATSVAVAHHHDDDVETVLHRLLRGTHLRGLAGMPMGRPLLETDIQLIRPMLELRRADIEAFAARHQLEWCEDHTNRDTQYTRNAIRHDLLPLLRERFNPRVDEALSRLSASATDVERFIASIGTDLLESCNPTPIDADTLALDLGPLLRADPVPVSYAIREALEQFGAPMRHIGYDRLRAIDICLTQITPFPETLPGNIRVERTDTQVVFQRGVLPTDPEFDAPIFLNIPGVTPLGTTAIDASIVPHDLDALASFIASPPHAEQWIDADALVGPVYARSRAPGDRFTPLGAPGRQHVGDFLTNLKLPRRQRHQILCLHDDLGIVCVWPARIDDRVKITPATQRVLKLRGLPDA